MMEGVLVQGDLERGIRLSSACGLESPWVGRVLATLRSCGDFLVWSCEISEAMLEEELRMEDWVAMAGRDVVGLEL